MTNEELGDLLEAGIPQGWGFFAVLSPAPDPDGKKTLVSCPWSSNMGKEYVIQLLEFCLMQMRGIKELSDVSGKN